MKITTIGLDFAKQVFQVHAADVGGRVVARKEIAEALSQVPKQAAGRGSVLRYFGRAAEVRLNKATGTIVTVIRFSFPGATSTLR